MTAVRPTQTQLEAALAAWLVACLGSEFNGKVGRGFQQNDARPVPPFARYWVRSVTPAYRPGIESVGDDGTGVVSMGNEVAVQVDVYGRGAAFAAQRIATARASFEAMKIAHDAGFGVLRVGSVSVLHGMLAARYDERATLDVVLSVVTAAESGEGLIEEVEGDMVAIGIDPSIGEQEFSVTAPETE